MPGLIKWCTCLTLVLIAIDSAAQQIVTQKAAYKTIAAAPAYRRSGFHQWLWGRNCRTAWATPVHVPVLWLDSVCGGLKPYKKGGGNETRSLRLRNALGKEYVLRSINKSRDDVVPPELKNTFLEDIIKDGISMSHPYGAFAVAGMLQAAGIYHTLPTLVYVPAQPALDTFNKKYGNELYLFEQKPDGDWSDAANLGNFTRFYNTKEVIDLLQHDSRSKAAQLLFLKARLFDMLIADWDRHEDNWTWGAADSANALWFIPIPRDRDQAFFTHNGLLIDRMIHATGLGYMQHFDQIVKDIAMLNVEEKDMDRFFTNALSLNDWITVARNLQQVLTDAVIERSILQLPPEIYAVSGRDMIDKLKARSKQIVNYAIRYYTFLAREVEITGTWQRDIFMVNGAANGATTVSIYVVNKDGQRGSLPYYQRTFVPQQTREIRLYGLNGNDVYVIEKHTKYPVVRVIGGPGQDSVIQTGSVIHIYDNAQNIFQATSVKKHLSSDTSVHAWNYEWYNYNVKGIVPSLSYDNADRFYAGLSYRIKKYKWRKTPFVTKQSLGVYYSLSQKAISATWRALYANVIPRWSLSMEATYDAMRWTNFYGTGNNTKMGIPAVDYYRLQTEEWLASAGLFHTFGRNTIGIAARYQQVRNRNDTTRFVSKIFSDPRPDIFKPNRYAGAQCMYSYVMLNDSVVPVKGFSVLLNGTWMNNFTQKEFFQRYDAKLQTFIPLSKRWSLAIYAGGATVVNDNVLNTGQYYEHAVTGGPEWLRGYRRERFWGKSAFYNNNELRYIFDLHTRLVNARVGLLAFFDDGRVWMPGESSHKLHTAFGPGLLFSPFRKLSVTLTYGISEEMSLFQLRFNSLL